MSIVSEMVRRNFKKGDDVRDAGLKTPDDIVRFDDIVYGENKKWQVLDVYRPKAAGDKELPVIVSVHGGGWVYGDEKHELGHVFHCNRKLEEAKKCNAEECDFFKKFC